MIFLKVNCLLITVASILSAALHDTTTIYTVNTFVAAGLANDPRLREKNDNVNNVIREKSAIRNSAILPRLEASFATGPAPEYVITHNASGDVVEKYDFSTINPFFGTELKVLQPLNIDRLLNGLKAASFKVNLSECDARKARIDMSKSYQELYFRYVYAKEMVTLAQDVKENLQKAIDKVKVALDDDAEGVTQNDLLELRTQQFKIDDGLYQAKYGERAAYNAMSFCIQIDSFNVVDSVLTLRTERIPEIDTLKKLMFSYHPDLDKLKSGLKAQSFVVKVAKGELLPDAFAMGSYKFSRAWSNKEFETSTEDLLNPYNKKEGSLGVGLRFNLNYWSLKDKYVKEKSELDALEYKSTYAPQGLFLELETQYQKVKYYREREISAGVSLENADALLKAAAMKYDLDKSKVKDLLNAYEKNVQAKKDYFGTILDYNIAVADLIAKCGLELGSYISLVK